MITSQYILDILDLSFDGHPQSDLLRKQIPFLSVSNIEHTGTGVFIHFTAEDQIQQFKFDIAGITTTDIEGNSINRIDGVEINNPELSILADAIVHLKNGIIDHLEIWNKCGKDYVLTEPIHYQLDQLWAGMDKRRTITR